LSLGLPFVSVIVTNFNGKRYLFDCLESLSKIDYPKEKYEVILVDNCSTDGSVGFVRTEFPPVKIIQNKRNLGFAEGNNVGIRHAKGEFLILLNNDTIVDRKWLIKLVEVAQGDSSIGSCASKILFFPSLILEIHSNTWTPSEYKGSTDNRRLGVALESIRVQTQKNGRSYPYFLPVEYLEGFYDRESYPGLTFRWTQGKAKVRVPIPKDADALRLNLRLGGWRHERAAPANLSLYANGHRLQVRNATLPKTGSENFTFTVGREILEDRVDVICNTGIILYEDIAGADRGFREIDKGQYDRVEEVFGACGASALYRKKMFEDVGLFDGCFFAYYEDTDLAWRSRLRGWKCKYTHESVVYHVHAGTSTEWSPFFIYHVERNRICMLVKNSRLRSIPHALLLFFGLTLSLTSKYTLSKLAKRRLPRGFEARVKMQSLAAAHLLRVFPELIKKRILIQRNRLVSHAEIEKWFVKR